MRSPAITPTRIERGQRIGICAPAGPIHAERLRRGAEKLRESFEVVLAPSVIAAVNGEPTDVDPAVRYLSASDETRARELNALIADPSIRAIVLARGGYGLARILPALDGAALRRDPKPIVAFSDGTALLAWAHGHGVRGIHGPMVEQFGELPAGDQAWLVRMLTSPEPTGAVDWQLDFVGSGTTTSALLGGNLALLSHLVGTLWQLPTGVTFIEDIGEKPYAIDRYLTHLAGAALLHAGDVLAVGSMTRCMQPLPGPGQPDDPSGAFAVIRERIAALELRGVFGLPIGHGDRNLALPFGAACTIDFDRKTLAIDDAAVA